MDALLEHDADILRPPWGAWGRDVTLGLVSTAAKLLLRGLNTLRADDEDLRRFERLVARRDPGVGLLTYCNHTSTFDDPGLPSAMLPWWLFWRDSAHDRMRWTMCAKDVCFKSELLAQFFLSGKTLPVERGASAHQPVVAAAGRLLGAGAWLHVFPEGRVQPGGDVGPFRQGIGKLVCDARAAAGGRDPVVLPYFHSGMARVVPYLSAVPRAGHTVDVVVGEPVDLSAITCRCGARGADQEEVWRDIAAALREALLRLEARAPRNPNQLEERPELRRIIAERCRRGTSATGDDDNGSSSSSRPSTSSSTSSSLMAEAAAKLARPCAGAAEAAAGGSRAGAAFNAWCNLTRRAPWHGDQERRQLQFAQLGALEGPGAAAGAGMAVVQQQQQQTRTQQQPRRWSMLLWRRGRAMPGSEPAPQTNAAAARANDNAAETTRPGQWRRWSLWGRRAPAGVPEALAAPRAAA